VTFSLVFPKMKGALVVLAPIAFTMIGNT